MSSALRNTWMFADLGKNTSGHSGRQWKRKGSVTTLWSPLCTFYLLPSWTAIFLFYGNGSFCYLLISTSTLMSSYKCNDKENLIKYHCCLAQYFKLREGRCADPQESASFPVFIQVYDTGIEVVVGGICNTTCLAEKYILMLWTYIKCILIFPSFHPNS